QLPLNQMSPIIEDADGFYIIRVVERQPEGFTPFREAQVEIAEKIKLDHREQQIKDYYASLREEISIWTIFDDPQVAAKLPPTHR
ncbi:MAG: peptidyl-prolyl cis-trans isomerase, partial [Pirellulales bacterium]